VRPQSVRREDCKLDTTALGSVEDVVGCKLPERCGLVGTFRRRRTRRSGEERDASLQCSS